GALDQVQRVPHLRGQRELVLTPELGASVNLLVQAATHPRRPPHPPTPATITTPHRQVRQSEHLTLPRPVSSIMPFVPGLGLMWASEGRWTAVGVMTRGWRQYGTVRRRRR